MSEREPDTPFFLRVAMALGAVFGVLGTSVGLWALLRIAVSDGPFLIGDAAVSKGDFLVVAVPFLTLYVLACVTAGAASWALWKGRMRSRVLLTALLTEFVIGDAAMLILARRTFEVSGAELAVSALVFSFLVALGLWYLFRKEAVVNYYDSVRLRMSNGAE